MYRFILYFTSKDMKMNWFLLALIAMFSFAGITIFQKYLLNFGIHPITFGFYLMGFSFVGFLITAFIQKQNLAIYPSWIILLILAALFVLIGNLAATNSFKETPNPGYTQAIFSAAGVVVLLLSIFLFKSELSLIKVVGIILTTIGVILIGF